MKSSQFLCGVLITELHDLVLSEWYMRSLRSPPQTWVELKAEVFSGFSQISMRGLQNSEGPSARNSFLKLLKSLFST